MFFAEAPVANYVNAAVETICDIHEQKRDGDILAFLTGQDEVRMWWCWWWCLCMSGGREVEEGCDEGRRVVERS